MNCVNEYKIDDFEQQSKSCILFFLVSQFRSVDGLRLYQIEELGFKLEKTMPRCGIGQKLYGVKQDSSIIKLMEIIDSSD